MKRYVILTCEGVINQRHYSGEAEPCEPLVFLPGAVEGLRLLARKGFAVIVISAPPPPGGRWPYNKNRKRRRQRWLLEIALNGGRVERYYDRPLAVAEQGDARKISCNFLRGILLEHRVDAEDTYFISDSADDVAVATDFGCVGLLLQRDAFLDAALSTAKVPETVSNLREAAERITIRQANPLLRALEDVAPRIYTGR
jgi:D-glycero-D-manno-heptose 1,7-bisphosphate phosphatase